MASKKSTTAKKSSTTSAVKIKQLEEKLKDLTVQLEQFETENKILLEEKNDLVNVAQESVPKEVLRNEGLIERLNWYYKDLEGWKKVAAHFILLGIVSVLIFGSMFAYNQLGSDSDIYSMIMTVVMAVLSLFGISFNFAAFKSPKK